ncbi:MAG: ubiquinone biosynthesis regulatory protein kinase UbiB [Granulosicoccus sp.]|nr:ubiquinone biosynthesis regulatory protein kinase UbiB [Granulosicoccus sp.]
MNFFSRLRRLFRIERVIVKYALEDLVLGSSRYAWLKGLTLLSPTRWLNETNRKKPRGERLRLALEELGPVFIKLGQVLSTRRDLLPDDIGDELALLQDRVPPFSSAEAVREIESALDTSVSDAFTEFDQTPLASASVAQVHVARLHSGAEVIVKVLRPGIAPVIKRDVSLMYLIADLVSWFWDDARRLKPQEVVKEYDHTIHDELDLMKEATNAVTLRNNFKESTLLYVPEIYWDYTRKNVMVMERIHGIPIRDIPAMKSIGMDMKKLAEHGVEIFYQQVFSHNFFHADMHPGNIFVSPEDTAHPKYIAVDFGIVGSLTEEDQHYLGENMLAFFQRDYRRVAQLHVDSGWVPADTRVSDLEAAIRSVCEPIFEKPLAEISFGMVLMQLFHTARRFQMEVQPQLVLLQKTLLNIEGLGRDLYPQLDLWATAKPYLEQWVLERRGPAAIAKKLIHQLPLVIERLPEVPQLMHAALKAQSQMPVHLQSSPSQPKSQQSLKRVIAGAAVLISGALGASALLVSDRTNDLPWGIWLVLGVGSVLLLSGLFRKDN